MKYFIVLVSLLCIILPADYGYASEIWVSGKGSDENPGTREKPLASVAMAIRKARELRRLDDPSVKEGIDIIIADGTYVLDSPVLLRPEDSGTPDSPTIIRAAEGAHPVLSGGRAIGGWEKLRQPVTGLPKNAEGKVWVTDIPFEKGGWLQFRQLWVNGKKAVLANTLNDGTLDRILSVNKKEEALWIPTPNITFGNGSHPEFIIHQWWAIANLRVRNIEKEGRKTRLTFEQPESTIEFEHPWPAPFIDEKKEYNGNSAFFFSNAIELLNSPGEWFADYKTGKIYYWPEEGQDMQNAEVIVPFLQSITLIKGTKDRPVSHIGFKGITFAHTTWLRPSHQGHVPLQAGFYILDAYKLEEPGTPDKAALENQAWIGRQPAALEARYASEITIERCRFIHTAATAVDFVEGVSHSRLEGNVFSDIGGTGIQAGFFGDAAFEAHLPYDPSDPRELVRDIRIANNLVSDATNEDWGCAGVSVGYARNIAIVHNEITDVNYSGICVGWGWTKTVNASRDNLVHANRIHRFAKQMYDVGGVYTLSAQPNTEISENAIYDLQKAPYAHIPEHYQYVYLDEGSSYIRIINNWTEKDKFFSNTPGPGNTWENNGPDVAEEIKEKAGIQPEYRDILKK
ncbi:Right handed beta helix region [Sinomicrobium oceani]|uniref:Right handed beta helix region n=1 Tax=Sinomicrobium oceani TaxID=1150368 RepID=A0A1K1PWU9_9FLAO|nr:right-handed parallel beta-helix repeat-containing protein [Sinomicrobium oceani]SFW52112.1 Right handed beta helix region [Sinomicrobium oceani]